MSRSTTRAIERWTNTSVRLLAGRNDPVVATVERARELVRRAMDAGWTGPPFEPLALADLLKITVTPRDDVRDARTVPAGKDELRIEFNPNRPPMRVRYSLAHEIAHTLFPDCGQLVRNRSGYHEVTRDAWQLEALCNVAASEILMPAGSMPRLAAEDLTIEQLLEERRRFQVSTEALLIRIAKMSDAACAAFCASRIEHGALAGRYRLDYLMPSSGWTGAAGPGMPLSERSPVGECVAIGFTSTGRDRWADTTTVKLQCVAIPPYPGLFSPRVVGLAVSGRGTTREPLLIEVRGNALEPRGSGSRIIAHVVNDATPNWGGGGFAAALGRRFPEAQADFRTWTNQARSHLALGSTRLTRIDANLAAFHMVAQHGYGASAKPRIRYAALQRCLSELGSFAAEHGASVHMPRIGTGQAGGAWEVIRDVLTETLCARGVRVTVYELPDRPLPTPKQPRLSFGAVE